MKKVRVSLKRGVKSWSFVLYDSAESAFFLKDEPMSRDPSDEEYRRNVVIRPGDIAEIEWVGSEWVYDDESEVKKGLKSDFHLTHTKYDKIRIGKISMLKTSGKDTQKTGYLEVYSGWVHGGDVPWSQETAQESVRITPIKGKIHSKIDFSKIFVDSHLDDDETPEDEEQREIVLN